MKMKFFAAAREMANRSDHSDHQMGCVVVRKNRVLGYGYNTMRTHSRSQTRFRTIHAELSAVLNSKLLDLSGCEVYIYRETAAKIPAMARCCEACYNMLASLNVKKIYYSCDGSYKEEAMYG